MRVRKMTESPRQVSICMLLFVQVISFVLLANVLYILYSLITKTKKKKGRLRRYHPCRNARLPGHPCKCVLCDDCLLKGTVGTCDGRSSRSKGVKNKVVKHKADKKICRHSDYSTFQRESSDLYYNKKWREKNPDKCLDENCLNCKKDMYEGQFIE